MKFSLFILAIFVSLYLISIHNDFPLLSPCCWLAMGTSYHFTTVARWWVLIYLCLKSDMIGNGRPSWSPTHLISSLCQLTEGNRFTFPSVVCWCVLVGCSCFSLLATLFCPNFLTRLADFPTQILLTQIPNLQHLLPC